MAGGFFSINDVDFPPLLKSTHSHTKTHPIQLQFHVDQKIVPPSKPNPPRSSTSGTQVGSILVPTPRNPSSSKDLISNKPVVQVHVNQKISDLNPPSMTPGLLEQSSNLEKLYQGLLSTHPRHSINGIPCVSFNLDDKLSLMSRIKHIIVVKFSHLRPAFKDFQLFLLGLKFSGHFRISEFNKKHIFVQFDLFEDSVKLWMLRSCYIKGFQARLFRWNSEFNPDFETYIAPVWIHLPSLPLYMFEEKAVLSIASLFGSPLYIDSSCLNHDKVGSLDFCVAMDVRHMGPKEFWVEFVGNGIQVERFKQSVHYGEIPAFCLKCQHLGHLANECKAISTADLNYKAVEVGEVVKDLNSADVPLSSVFRRLKALDVIPTTRVSPMGTVTGGSDEIVVVEEGSEAGEIYPAQEMPVFLVPAQVPVQKIATLDINSFETLAPGRKDPSVSECPLKIAAAARVRIEDKVFSPRQEGDTNIPALQMVEVMPLPNPPSSIATRDSAVSVTQGSEEDTDIHKGLQQVKGMLCNQVVIKNPVSMEIISLPKLSLPTTVSTFTYSPDQGNKGKSSSDGQSRQVLSKNAKKKLKQKQKKELKTTTPCNMNVPTGCRTPSAHCETLESNATKDVSDCNLKEVYPFMLQLDSDDEEFASLYHSFIRHPSLEAKTPRHKRLDYLDLSVGTLSSKKGSDSPPEEHHDLHLANPSPDVSKNKEYVDHIVRPASTSTAAEKVQYKEETEKQLTVEYTREELAHKIADRAYQKLQHTPHSNKDLHLHKRVLEHMPGLGNRQRNDDLVEKISEWFKLSIVLDTQDPKKEFEAYLESIKKQKATAEFEGKQDELEKPKMQPKIVSSYFLRSNALDQGDNRSAAKFSKENFKPP